MILRDRIESCLRVLDKYHYVQCTTALPSARCSCGLHLVKSSLRANWHQLEAERDALAADLAAARAERNAYREAMAQMNAPAIAMAALRPAPPIIMPAQDWDLHQQIQTLNERIAYLEPIRIAAQELVDNAEEYECDGLGLWAQHGWWEPLHDALDPDGSEAADDIRKSVAPAK